MKRDEFIALYPGVDVAYHTKSWKTIVALEKEGRLNILAYCDVMVNNHNIMRFSGLCESTVVNYKKGRTASLFVYAALREKSVKSLAEEYSR